MVYSSNTNTFSYVSFNKGYSFKIYIYIYDPFESPFVFGARYGLKFIFFPMTIQSLQHHL